MEPIGDERPYLDFVMALANEFDHRTDILIVPNGYQKKLEGFEHLLRGKVIVMNNVTRVSIIRVGGNKRPGEIPMF